MITFKIVAEEKECRSLWEKFSEKQILWDVWDFRFCFHTNDFNFHFIVGTSNGQEIGILPLVYYKPDKYYTYFGDEFPEQNKFFLNDKKNIGIFLKNCPANTKIFYIDSKEAGYYPFEPSDKRYFIDLEKHTNSFEAFLKSFNKKHRKNLTYDLKKLRERNYNIEKNKIEDFELLVSLNKGRFGQESTFHDVNFAESMKVFVQNALRMGLLDLLAIKIDGKKEAVGLGVIYNRIYYVSALGRNIAIKNLGKLLVAEQIKSAISHKCSEVNFLSTESSWKELWNFDSEQMYMFKS